MSFTRTDSGLSGLASFFDVEYLVYSEGGAIAPDEGGGEKDVWSIDSVFWRGIFQRFLPGAKVKIKSLGSKESVKPYAEKILKNDIDNSIAVLDRDYDNYRGDAYDHARIIYTHGYSWENDVCRPELLISVLNDIHPGGEIPKELAEEIKGRFKVFLSNINRIVYVDLLCGLVRIEGINRKNFWGLIDTTNSFEYKVKRDGFFKLIADIKSRKTKSLRYVGGARISPDCDCYGKILSMFCYLLFREYYSSITKCKNVSRHFADKMMAESIRAGSLDDVPDIKSHYECAIRRLAR